MHFGRPVYSHALFMGVHCCRSCAVKVCAMWSGMHCGRASSMLGHTLWMVVHGGRSCTVERCALWKGVHCGRFNNLIKKGCRCSTTQFSAGPSSTCRQCFVQCISSHVFF